MPATVGLNAGDSVTFSTVTGSNTGAIINVSSTTNIGIPGMWAFQVNQAQISGIHSMWDRVAGQGSDQVTVT